MKFLALAATASAMTYELNTFRPENWANIYKAMLTEEWSMTPAPGAGTVTWSQCPDQAGVWTFDTKDSTYSPNPFKKGNTVSFNLVGTESQPIHIDKYSVKVSLGSKVIDTLTFPGGDFTNTWAFSLSEKLPIIAPSGHYTINAVGTGSTGGVSGTVMCGQAQFDL